MRRIKDVNGLKTRVKKQLRTYLERVGTEFSSNGQQFQCPARAIHANEDRNQSCGFFPDDTRWHCFTCSSNGDIFNAANQLEDKPLDGSNFIEKTLVYLADLLKVAYDFEELSPEEKIREQVYAALATTAELGHMGMNKSDVAKEYVKARGWEKIAGSFKLGYCSYEKLVEVLKKKGYEFEVLKQAGLIDKELFDHRLLFPIADVYGRVVAFASRSLKDDGSAKYVNSSTTAVYKKSDTLYNLHRIDNNTETVWLVEGFADVISLVQSGVRNVVGLCGVSFTSKHIDALVKKGVRSVVLCLDGDAAGQLAESKIMDDLQPNHGIGLYVKVRDGCKDPDECLSKHDFLIKSGHKPMFDHFLDKYKEDNSKITREKALRAILLERSPIDREQLCKRMAKELGVRVEVILQEFDAIIERQGDPRLVDEAEIMREKAIFERDLMKFEADAWKRSALLGLKVEGFPIFTDQMDGIQPYFYIIAGEAGAGKSALSLNIARGLLKANPGEVFVLYFSIDDALDTMIARMLAMETGFEINTVRNPKYRIQLNTDLSPQRAAEMVSERKAAVERLIDEASTSLVIKDETEIRNIQEMEKTIQTFKAIAGDKQLVVFVDSLHRIRVAKKYDGAVREAFMEISNELKRWSNQYKVPIIATSELRKMNQKGPNAWPTADDVKEASDFKYDCGALMLLYNDFRIKGPEFATLKFEHPEGSNRWFPTVGVRVWKNKTSAFDGRLFYKFFTNTSIMHECTAEEQERHNQMIPSLLTEA